MPNLLRSFMTALAAYAVGMIVAVIAMLALVDIGSVNLQSGLPTIAIMTPMLAVVVFWTVARLLGHRLDLMRTLLFGAVAIYGLLYACGCIIASNSMSEGSATFLGAFALFGLAFWAVRAFSVRF